MPHRTPKQTETDPRWTSEVEPAPGELRIVQAFVNSTDPWAKTEELTTPQALGRWLLRWRLTSEEPDLTAADLDLALALREGARAMLHVNAGGELGEKAFVRFERAAAKVPLRLRIDPAGGAPYLTAASAASDGKAGLGRLLGVLTAARLGESWIRLKVCADGRCGTAFFDASRGRRRKWCSKRCADRIAGRRYRLRRGIEPRAGSRS